MLRKADVLICGSSVDYPRVKNEQFSVSQMYSSPDLLWWRPQGRNIRIFVGMSRIIWWNKSCQLKNSFYVFFKYNFSQWIISLSFLSSVMPSQLLSCLKTFSHSYFVQPELFLHIFTPKSVCPESFTSIPPATFLPQKNPNPNLSYLLQLFSTPTVAWSSWL